MNIELKPCPFCGGKVEARISPNSRSEEGASFYEVRCKKCGVHVTGKSFNFWNVKYDREKPQDLLSAVERWNKRAYAENGRKTGKRLVEKLEKLCDVLDKHADAIANEPNAYYGRNDAIFGFTFAKKRIEAILAEEKDNT